MFLPQLVRLTAMLKPGLHTINVRVTVCSLTLSVTDNRTSVSFRSVFFMQWTNQNWTQFYDRCKQAIETFEVLVARVHDIYSNRILNVLMWMQEVSLQILPAGVTPLLIAGAHLGLYLILCFSKTLHIYFLLQTMKSGQLMNFWSAARRHAGKFVTCQL